MSIHEPENHHPERGVFRHHATQPGVAARSVTDAVPPACQDAEMALRSAPQLSGGTFVIESAGVDPTQIRPFLDRALEPIVEALASGMQPYEVQDIIRQIVIQDYQLATDTAEQVEVKKQNGQALERAVADYLGNFGLKITIYSLVSHRSTTDKIIQLTSRQALTNVSLEEEPALKGAPPQPPEAKWVDLPPPPASFEDGVTLPVHPVEPFTGEITVHPRDLSDPLPPLPRPPQAQPRHHESTASTIPIEPRISSVATQLPRGAETKDFPNHDMGVDCTAAVVALADSFKRGDVGEDQLTLFGHYLDKLAQDVRLRLAIHTGQNLYYRIHLFTDEENGADVGGRILHNLATLLYNRLKSVNNMRHICITFGIDYPDNFNCSHNSALNIE